MFLETFFGAVIKNGGVLLGLVNAVSPFDIDTLETLGLSRQLLHDIGGVENGLQVHPLSLALNPFFEGIRHQEEFGAPLFDLILKGLLEGRELHGLCGHNMLIKHLDGIVEASDERSGGVLELRKVEILALPVCLHLTKTFLDVVLLEGLLTDIFADFSVSNHALVNDLLESELLIRADIEADCLGQVVPMAVFHTILSEGNRDGNNWLELINVDLHLLSDGENLGQVLVSELTENPIDLLHAFLKSVVKFLRVEIFPRIIEPGLVRLEPSSGGLPEITVGLELVGHLLEPIVVGEWGTDQELTLVENTSHLDALLNLLVDVVDSLGVLNVLIDVVVGSEASNGDTQVVEGLFEVNLFLLHLFDHGLLLLLEDVGLLLDELHHLLGSTIEFPLGGLLGTRELVVELIKDSVDVHNLINFFLHLLDDDSNLSDKLVGLGEVLNSLGRLQDSVVDLAKPGGDAVVPVFGLAGNKLDLLVVDLSVLSGIKVSNVLTVDLEHVNDDSLRDLILKLLFLLFHGEDVSSEFLGRDRGVTGIEALNVLVGVQAELLLESGEGLDVLAEGLDSSFNVLNESLKGVPQPGVLVDHLFWLLRVGKFRLLVGNNRRLDILLSVGTEDSLHEDGLELGDSLHLLDTSLEDFPDLVDDL